MRDHVFFPWEDLATKWLLLVIFVGLAIELARGLFS